MAKLYPPQLEGTIPAFYGKKLIVPFIMNKTVGWNEIQQDSGFHLMVKSIQNNNVIYNIASSSYNKDKCEAYFDIADDKINLFKIGNSYKIQIAYRGNDSEEIIGYYSTVAIVKYTTKPDVSIVDLESNELHTNRYTYLGKYSQKQNENGKNIKDSSEKVYSYRFDLYDWNGELVETSGDLLHNHENNESIYETNDKYTIKTALEANKTYTLYYSVITANGLRESSPGYRIAEQSTIPPEAEIEFDVIMNQENGYVDFSIRGKTDENGMEKNTVGTFLISRSSSENNFTSWDEMHRFAIFGDKPSKNKWRDFTVQHGFTYIYSLQQYNKEYQIYSNRVLSEPVEAQFEHSFLYDGKRQLKIKYNPKVTSFKETLLESKTNTMGGKYPFFFRNGNVGYKEFPISGLISYQSDEEQLFLTDQEMFLDDFSNLKREHTLIKGIKSSDYNYFNEMLDANYAYNLQREYSRRETPNSNENLIASQRYRTTNLTNYNITAERIFKMKVLDFLNDGKPKLFRSPGEGNFIVRLMNSSLSPNDQLGRMLHTFSTTATEIDSYSYSKLNDYELLTTDEPNTKQLRWKTISLDKLAKVNKSKEDEKDLKDIIIPVDGDDLRPYITGYNQNIYSIQCLDMIPGEQITLRQTNAVGDPEDLTIQIGVTGAYFAEFNKPIDTILFTPVNQNHPSGQGQVTFSYYGENLNHFDTYQEIKLSDLPVKQFIGEHKEDILNELEDLKYKVTEYYFLNFTKRPVIELTKQGNNLYYQGKQLTADEIKDPDDLAIYKIGETYYDGRSEEIGASDAAVNYENKVYIDGKEIDLTETNDFQLIKPDYIPKITMTSGIVADISIQRREIVYDVENKDEATETAKADYLEALQDVKDEITLEEPITINNEWPQIDINNYENNLRVKLNNLTNKYNIFLEVLQKALDAKGAVLS